MASNGFLEISDGVVKARAPLTMRHKLGHKNHVNEVAFP